MILESLCKIDVVFKKTAPLTRTVENTTTAINAAFIEMGIENTTGQEPSDSKDFENLMKKAHKEIKFLIFTNLARDVETDTKYIMLKEEDFDIKNVLRKARENKRLQNRKIV